MEIVMTKMDSKKNVPVREYLTVLLRRRSVIALCCVTITLILAFYGIIDGVIRENTVQNENGFQSFIYYTMVSNTFAALSAAFVFPFAVEGIRKKRLILPKWAALLHYMATVTIAITMVFVLAFISWASPSDAFGGTNFITHLICPPLIILSFFQIESGHILSWKDRLLGIVPGFSYLVVYFVCVALIGEDKGGWPDIYHVLEHLPAAVAIPSFILLAFSVSTVIAVLSNLLTKKRRKKMFLLWDKDPDPIEVKIEAYGMGRMAAQYGEGTNIQIPYDILTDLATMCNMDTEELMRPFTTGMMVECKNREKAANREKEGAI